MLVSVRSAVKNGLKVKANFILGFPDETYRHVWETLGYIFQFALAGVHDAGVFNFSPYPGSELFNRLEKEGKIKLTDKYFYGLSQYTDPGITRSYSKHISHGGLQMLLLSTMMMFYGVQYTIRPWRFFELVSSVLRNRPKTKLDTALVRILERRRIRRNIENEKVLSPT